MYDVGEQILMDAKSFKSLTATKKFKDSNKLSDLSYSDDGLGLIVAAEEAILVYDLRNGTSKGRPIECKKYGVELVEYSDSDHCLHSATTDSLVRMLNLQKKVYVRYFPGHTKRINSIRMNPKSHEKFMTGSDDGTIRFFDRRIFENFGFLQLSQGQIPLSAYDPEGIIFAVASRNDTIRLFDVRSFDLGPFATFRIEKDDTDEWTRIDFSPCGKFILVSTKGNGVKLIDTFSGKQIHNFSQHRNPNKLSLRATISSDSAFVMVGSADRNIYVYSNETGDLSCKLPTDYSEPSHAVAFNPSQFLMTSLGNDVILWAPSQESL